MAIFLALFPENAQECHVRWEGHKTVDSAKAELDQIRTMMIKENRIPMDCYIYEAENPPLELPIHAIDDVDFNFYREKTPEEIAASARRFEEAMALVKRTKDKVERAEELANKLKEKIEAKTDAKV